MDKYEVMGILEAFVDEDEQCSKSCSGCRYEKLCTWMGEENILETFSEKVIR